MEPYPLANDVRGACPKQVAHIYIYTASRKESLRHVLNEEIKNYIKVE